MAGAMRRSSRFMSRTISSEDMWSRLWEARLRCSVRRFSRGKDFLDEGIAKL